MTTERSLFKVRPCKRCRRDTQQEICKAKGTSGYRAAWWCPQCEQWADAGVWIPIDKLELYGADLEFVREVNTRIGERCSRCGARGAELHHWAPRAYFGAECDNWPTDYLCRKCHDRWHALVTPGLVQERKAS